MAKVFKKGLTVGFTVMFFLVFYPLKLAHYACERLFVKYPKTYAGFQEVFAETFCTVQDAIKILLPEAQDIKEETKILTDTQKQAISKNADVQFNPELDKEYHFYIGQANGQIVGYAVENTVKGKWGPIRYILALDPEGKIKDVLILELKEKRGRPVKERKFLDQFLNMTISDPIRLKKDIKGITGATISSKGMSDGIRKIVYVFNELYKK